MTKKEKMKLAEELFYRIDNEGLSYYFTQYGPDLESLEKLGFDMDRIKKAMDNLDYLNEVFSDLEDMM